MPVMSKPTKMIDLDEAREEARRFAFYEAWEEAEQQGMDEWYQRADEPRDEQFAGCCRPPASRLTLNTPWGGCRNAVVKIDDNRTVAFRAPGPRQIERNK